MSQALALAVLAGVISGGLGLAPLSGSFGLILVSYFVQLPIMLAGLTMGLPSAIVAVVTAGIISTLIAGLLPAFIYLAAFALPALWVVRQALLSRQDQAGLVWYPPGLILAQLTVMAVLAIAFAFFAFMGQPGGLLGVIETMLTQAFEELSAAAGQSAPDLSTLSSKAAWMPALVACSWLIMAVVNGVLAQAIAVRSGWARRPSPQLSALDLPFWLWPLMGGALLAAMLGSSGLGMLGRSALIVLVVPFGFQGLAVIHKFANRWTYRQLGLAAVYAGIIVFNWPILAVVALGLVEDWAHLRRYM
ncbi:MAG: DUF2232 domain-containing protein [Geminicoccaceae bacterium]